MTPQEAIELIGKIAFSVKNEIEEIKASKFITALKMAKEALEKQIPKKPVIVGEEYIFEKDEWEKDYECPFCGNPYADDSFCSCCGQALDWSDTE